MTQHRDAAQIALAEMATEGAADRDLERTALGTWIAYGDRVDTSGLHLELFTATEHRWLYRLLEQMDTRGEPIDIATVCIGAQSLGIQKYGGAHYVSSLVDNIGGSGAMPTYISRLKERYQRRELRYLGQRLTASDYTLDEAAAELERISGRSSVAKPTWMCDAMAAVVDDVPHRRNRPPGLLTGLSALDRLLGGLQPGRLYLVGARPGMGKSALALTIALEVSSTARVAFFSLEMPAPELAERALAMRSEIPAGRIKYGLADVKPLQLVVEDGYAILIDDRCDITPAQLRASAKQYHRRHGIGLIVVDYLQLMRVTIAKGATHAVAMAEVSRALKTTAMELRIPVLALSQLNRRVEHRGDKRLRLSDLRDSGGLEQDADVVMFVYRDEEANGIAEIIVAKQRNGPCGTAKLLWEPTITSFRDLPEGER